MKKGKEKFAEKSDKRTKCNQNSGSDESVEIFYENLDK